MPKFDPFTGRYLFHFHTCATDGELTIEDYFLAAANLRIDSLIFLEHIRSLPTYDIDSYAAAVRLASRQTGIPSFLGFEAKIQPGGSLDISPQHFEQAQVVGIAEHGFPDDSELLWRSLRRSFESSTQWQDKIAVWVHPGTSLRKRGKDPEDDPEYLRTIEAAIQNGVRIERNLRYRLISDRLCSRLSAQHIVLGADAHNRSDLDRWASAWAQADALPGAPPENL